MVAKCTYSCIRLQVLPMTSYFKILLKVVPVCDVLASLCLRTLDKLSLVWSKVVFDSSISTVSSHLFGHCTSRYMWTCWHHVTAPGIVSLRTPRASTLWRAVTAAGALWRAVTAMLICWGSSCFWHRGVESVSLGYTQIPHGLLCVSASEICLVIQVHNNNFGPLRRMQISLWGKKLGDYKNLSELWIELYHQGTRTIFWTNLTLNCPS